MSDKKREWFAMNMSTNEIYDYAQGLKYRLGLWKRVAKKHRDRYHTCHDSYMRLSDIYDSVKGFEATAIRRKGLLEEVRQLLDDIYAEDIVSSGDLGKVYEKIERELGDAVGSQG